MAAELNDVLAAGEVSPREIGLGAIADDIACIVRTDSAAVGANATIVMRAGLTESEVTHALWDAGFGDPAHSVMVHEDPSKGEARSVLFHTYGGLTSDWTGGHFAYQKVFPPETVVLEADLRVPLIRNKCTGDQIQDEHRQSDSHHRLPEPGARVVSCRPQTAAEFKAELDALIDSMPEGPSCRDVTSFDRNWQNDMLCTRRDGSRFYTDYQGAVDFLGYDSTTDIGH